MSDLSRRTAITLAAATAGLATMGAAPVSLRWPAAPGDMNLGNPNAPVRIVEYLSLTCSHCAEFHAEVFPALKAKYIDTGRVYFTARELLTAPAQVAAAGFLMARCNGGRQYFAVVAQVLRSQSRWREGSIKPVLLEIAKANGLTEDQFEACITDEKAQTDLDARLTYATDVDRVSSTPAFFVNGVPLHNKKAPTLVELDAAIAKALQPAPKPVAKPALKPTGRR